MPLSSVVFGELTANSAFADDLYLLPAYLWAERELGFYPFFLTLGGDDELTIGKTGYGSQFFRSRAESGADGNTMVRQAEKDNPPNKVLLKFPFGAIESPVFVDRGYWSMGILNTLPGGLKPSTQLVKRTFKPSWRSGRWLRWASQDSYAVDVLAPKLDLRRACQVWVRNRPTQRHLARLGFENVVVRRFGTKLAPAKTG